MPYVIPQEILSTNKKEEDVGFFESALAGVATGLWNIPKGFVSLGAEIYDLAADTNTAKDVEKWFDDVNPWDDEAEARTVGKITQALAQIAPVAVGGAALGARAAANFARTNAAKTLATRALDAKKAGKYLSLARIGQKFTGPTAGAVIGGGVGESLVADEDIGTLADILKGTSLEPYAITMMDRETKEGREEAYRRLVNRLKFGTEGALFNLALIGAGRGVKNLRKPSEEGLQEYAESSLGRALQKFGIAGLKPEGTGTKLTLEAKQTGFGAIKAVEFGAGKAVEEFDKALKEVFPAIEKNYLIAKEGITTSDGAQRKFLDEVYEVLRPSKGSPDDILLTKTAKERAAEQLKTIDPSKPRALFKIEDYQITPRLQKILNQVKQVKGNPENLKNAILNFRLAIDNMSGRLLQRQLPEEVAEKISNELGRYLTTEYKQFNRLMPLKKYKVTDEQIQKATELLTADKTAAYIRQNKLPPNTVLNNKERIRIIKEVDDEINSFLKLKSIDQVDVLDESFKDGVRTVIDKPTKREIESVRVNPGILRDKVLRPWQEELAGVIKDPRYTFYSTVGKQAHLNYTLKYLDDIKKLGSTGKNKFIFNADELSFADRNNPLRFKKVEATTGLNGLSQLEGSYIRAPIYDAIFDVTSNWLNRSSVGDAYKYMILAPKAISQIAKTILSPITHVRNFISAGAFAAANGAIFPSFGDIKTLAPKFLGGEGLVSTSYGLTGKRVFGTMTKADEALYKRLLNVGVVDSQVQKGESMRLIKDAFGDPAATDSKVMRGLVNAPEKLKKVYGKVQDAYVGEDDFWKIISWNLERNRYEGVLNKLNINKDNYLKMLGEDSNVGRYFRKITPRAEYAAQSYDNFLDEVAGNLVRNNVPNYGYVGRTAKALRQSPFGNFIAFPLEIMRTGNNIFTTAIDEITSGIPELVGQGYRRLFSFGMTVGGVPLVMTEIFKSKNNVTDEELDALRRYVPEWSKNSTLIPTGRNEKGYLKYIDFSYSNAYDALTRPFRSIVNEISAGDATEDSLKKALATGLTDGFVELLEPFASESIFTEALIDSTFRRGIGRGGRRVWSEEDDPFVKIAKGTGHILKSLEPGSISQLKRLNDSVKGKSDKYGRSFELKDELPGLAGFRSIQSDPEFGITFKITRFGSNLKKDENLFTKPLLRGGRVTPEDVIDVYKYSESRRFQTMREMYKDIEAARKLGVSEASIRNKLRQRKGLGKEVVNSIMLGRYLPDRPSSFFIKRMREINNKLNDQEGVDIPNPYFEALPKLNEIINKNRGLNLLTDEIKIPEDRPVLVEPQAPTIQTPPLRTPMPAAPQPTTQLPSTQAQTYASLFPRDELGNLIAQRKIT